MLLIFLLALIKGIYFSHFGLNFYNYGETLHNATRILNGEILYRDIWALFPPGFTYFPALIFKVFGKNLLIIRYAESFLFAVLISIIVLLAKEFLSKRMLILLAVVLIFSDINTYLLFPYVFFYAALLLAILYLKSRHSYLIFLSGLTVGLGFLFRHDLAIITVLTIGFLLIVSDKVRSAGPAFFLSLLGVVLPTLVFIKKIWSLKEFIYLALVKAPQISKALSPGFNIKSILALDLSYAYALRIFTLWFYLVYISVYLLIILKLIKEPKRKIVILSLFVFGLLQIPHAISVFEMGHLVKAGIPAIILGFYLVQEGMRPKKRISSRLLLLSPIMLFLAGNLVMSAWWINFNDTEVNFSSGSVYLNSRYVIGSTLPSSNTIKNSIIFIQENTKESDYIFVAPYHAILYFLAGRKDPSRFNNFVPRLVSESEEAEVIRSIEAKRVKIVVYDPVNAPHGKKFADFNPQIHNYLMENFEVVQKTPEGWLFMKRKTKV